MNQILKITYLYIPLILAGTCNMIFVKLPYLNQLKKPMDGNIVLGDRRRLFGDNKSWKGFFGMIVFTTFWFSIFFIAAKKFPGVSKLSLIPYASFDNVLLVLSYGVIWGLSYVVFELPNSFVKRRLDIEPGKKTAGWLGTFFVFMDQADSVLGVALAMLVFYVPDGGTFLAIIGMGIILHYIMNIIFFFMGIKKRIG